MIDPKELRIRNWILCDGQPAQVELIDPLQGYRGSWGKISIENPDVSGDYIGKWLKDCTPIRLAPDVLLAAGFDHDLDWFQLCTGNFIFDWDPTYGLYLKIEGQKMPVESVQYLHQLQNLFHAFSGQELEINLKQVA